MKILLVSDEYSPCWGPCTVRLRVFSDVFRQLGHEVTVLASSTNLAHGAGDDNAVYCSAPKLDKSSALSRLKNNLGFALSAYRAGVRLDKPDVVIATSPPVFAGLAGWRIARAKGAKFVYDVRDIWPDVAVEMGSFSRGGDQSAKAIVSRAQRKGPRFLGRAVGGVNVRFKGHAQSAQGVRRLFHHGQIAVASHDDANFLHIASSFGFLPERAGETSIAAQGRASVIIT